MRRRLAVAALLLAFAPSAQAAPPAASVQLTSTGTTFTFTAGGDAVSWHWDFGDGTTADGQTVSHAYRPGRWTATLTATGASGETAAVQTPVTVYLLTLRAPKRAEFGSRVRFTGRLTPAERGVVSLYHGKRRVSTAKLKRGAFAVATTLHGGGAWYARYGSVRSLQRTVAVKPVVDARLDGAGVVGSPLILHARVQPGGPLRVRVLRNGRKAFERTFDGRARVELGTAAPGTISVAVSSADVRSTLTTSVVEPHLALGSRSASVRALEQRLRELRYMLKAVDGLYAYDTYEAVLAFQKANGLARTGRVDAALWRRLRSAHTPAARYPQGSHIEVDKGRQILLRVENGVVVGVLHVSTGATGNTPLGTWHVYLKVSGWNGVLWYPLFFKGGFAIHGYPSVPAYPASHGCVRVPMWAAPHLFSHYDYGTAVVVYA